MKLHHLITEDSDKLASIYLKGVKQTGVLKLFKGSFALSRGREDEIVSETVRLIKAGLLGSKSLWNYFGFAKDGLKLNGDVANLLNSVTAIERLAGSHAPTINKELKDAALAMQVLIENNNTLYSGIYKCKNVLDELAGLALKRYSRNTSHREVSEEVSFAATMTLKGLGVWTIYQQALADGKTL